MFILSIESSCDESAIALVEAKGDLSKPIFKIHENRIASQINIHREFGGVVPNIAKREHEINLPILLKEVSKNKLSKKIDLISVTSGPGLEPALWSGIEFAKKLSKEIDIPLVGANHLKGHLWSFLLSNPKSLNKFFPAIALVVSGGHTLLIKMDDLAHYKKIGETQDDAAGEALDKAARLLNLPYPGGPEIERVALTGNKNFIDFPRPMLHQKNYNFSFSGLKTSLLYHLKNAHKADWKDFNSGRNPIHLSPEVLKDTAASFQAAVVDSLVTKTLRATKDYQANSIVISGGVAANLSLRNELIKICKENKLYFSAPEGIYNTDNAAMIAVSTYIDYLRNKKTPLKANGNLNL